MLVRQLIDWHGGEGLRCSISISSWCCRSSVGIELLRMGIEQSASSILSCQRRRGPRGELSIIWRLEKILTRGAHNTISLHTFAVVIRGDLFFGFGAPKVRKVSLTKKKFWRIIEGGLEAFVEDVV